MTVRSASPLPSRPCSICLALQEDSVFADFARDEDGRLFLIRISFDGYCSHHPIDGIQKLSLADSSLLLSAVQDGTLSNPAVHRVLADYFATNRSALWEDALLDHALIEDHRTH